MEKQPFFWADMAGLGSKGLSLGGPDRAYGN